MSEYTHIPENFNVNWEHIYDVDNELVFHYYPFGKPNTVWQLRFKMMNKRQWKISKIFEEGELEYFIEIFTDLKQYESSERIQYNDSGIINILDIKNKFGKKVLDKINKI